jgi:hypothetical protein
MSVANKYAAYCTWLEFECSFGLPGEIGQGRLFIEVDSVL